MFSPAEREAEGSNFAILDFQEASFEMIHRTLYYSLLVTGANVHKLERLPKYLTKFTSASKVADLMDADATAKQSSLGYAYNRANDASHQKSASC